MTGLAHRFDDGPAYERFMGRWSKAAGAVFLDWLAVPAGLCWLDVGCGTGAFTELVLDRCAPASVIAVDPSREQIGHARGQPVARRADFRIADAGALPFPDDAFDVVASALAINFMPDRHRALREMHRVARAGGIVAGYVWNFAAELSPSWPLRVAIRRVGGKALEAPGIEETGADALHSLFARGGFHDIRVRSIDVTVGFADFVDFWEAQTLGQLPIARSIAALTRVDQTRLIEVVRTILRPCPDGSFEYSARATAIKARVPI